ncbi:hypothetical protein A6B43_03385 [Vespertiliibacter pulmonis]|uniref:Opacity associated protein n=1 Tax=Vespertiliibacter pulmonis TaxID=1443036 RepID=A0A3N4VN14_9PAST|nr:LysM-like peptidoglycan-binding domain-containing protein [Vespertiliibacter pulmonis]QLB20641.1 hypothetical protein A6B43_03385 [Vespertiliibacter pulmonis]RPE82775.1 opacity associated protein [Vespertiliibacter pulmonis]
MNPYNQRKEPVFGQPNVSTTDEVNEAEKKANQIAEEENVKPEKPKVAFSLHTKNAPNYTFTPVMKRPADSAQVLSTLEEKAEQTMSNEKMPVNESISPVSPETKAKTNGGFTFAPVTEEHQVTEPLKTEEKKETVAPNEPAVDSNTVERVIPATAAKVSKTNIDKVPSKYRRLIIVLLLLLLVGIAIVLLKPKTPESVETLQEQGSSLPIEFRPVDEEEAKRAEAQAKALQEQAQQSTEIAVQPNVNEQSVQSVQNSSAVENVADTQTQAVQTSQTATVEQPTAKPVEHKPVVTVVRKPETAGSVIYQPEVVTKPTKVVQAVQPKNVQPKPTVHAVQPKAVEVRKPVEVVKAVAPTPAVKAIPAPTKVAAVVASKTLTVPKGVSLMQVFRDNNLNISDVNAMSKVNGIVSNLKVGERVTVRLDKNNRVVEMSIGSGGKFIRQESGSYIYR